MRLTKYLVVILLTVLLPVSFVLAQTDTGSKQENTVQEKKTADVPERPAVQKTHTKAKKNDVPEVPLTNARIAFDYTTFDFGTVPNGAKMTHYFPVQNTGPDTLYITKIKAG